MKKIFLLINVLCIVCWQNVVYADNKPILRLETGMHTAKITNIDVDTAERFLVTGSHDKTVRLWSLPEGQLIRTFRPPIGKGNEGKIYAVAISPDGKTIAAGGWTKGEWTGTGNHKIYLFDRATGELTQRITGHPNVIFHLAYSPDGRYLVTSLFGGKGIRIYRSTNYRQVAKDTDYGSRSEWAEFDNTGRLASSCDDGYIRLYDKNFNLLTKRKTPGGNEPFAVRFSPSGDKIAVGFSDSTQVNVLSGKNLKLLYSPNTQGINNGDISSVAWSQDGDTLYAGGEYDENGLSPIVSWSQAGKGKHQTWAASSNTITDIRTLTTGSVIFGAYDPAFGKFTAQGKKTLYHEAGIADFRGIYKDVFLISKNSNKVQFRFGVWGKRPPANFSVDKRILKLNPATNLIKPNISSLNITNWENAEHPKLNGQKLALEQYETSRSLAITPDAQHFLLGTEWLLRFFDKNGQQQWQKPVQGTAWGVNISGDGKVAIAAFGDGTIRWYRLNDGEELLAFFPHKDGKRWVIWTPLGYYAASANGDELIGWHVNRGPDKAADFYPAAQFRDRYYRPDVISKVLDTLDPEQALIQANQAIKKHQAELKIQQILPPIVNIISPADGANFSSSTIELHYRLRSPSNEKITNLKILIDGNEQRGPETTLVPDATNSLSISVPKRDIAISLIAENRYAASVPSTINLKYVGKKQTFRIPIKLYVLAVGISDYDNDRLDLNYAAKDARDFAKLLESQKDYGLYSEVVVKLLTDVNRDQILDGLEWIEKQVTQHDVAMVFFAGHGANNNQGDYVFMPRDFNHKRVRRTTLPYYELKSTMVRLAGKRLLFLDTCHSGNVLGTRRGIGDIDQIANSLSSAENGVVVFAASTGSQQSQEHTKWQNGAFTEALLEAFKQADYTKDGSISINELDLYVSDRVKKLTNGDQTPTTSKPETVPDFPVVVVR
ncbi:caspase family protein [Candidatus Halobeggiatoa sp. HSG11]|nr:caspase family protein [Candidatus Halobeggiatoa sp. HSG11]